MTPVELLNQAFAKDPNAIRSLLFNRVPCNKMLADDEYIPVDTDDALKEKSFNVGMLGIVNGIMASSGLPLIAAKWGERFDGTNEFLGFCEYRSEQEEHDE